MAKLRARLLIGDLEELEAGVCAASAAIAILKEFKSAGLQREQAGELQRLAADLRSCQNLVEHGLRSTRILADMLNGASGEYVRDGAKVAWSARVTISVQG